MRFIFRLEPLLKYRKHRRDVLRAVCADITANRETLLAQRSALAVTLAGAHRGSELADAICGEAGYASWLNAERMRRD